MVQSYTFELSKFNTILFGDPLRDLTIEIPEVEDIEAAIDDLTIDLPDVEALLDDFIDNVVAEVQAAAIDTDQLVDDFVDAVEAQLTDIVLDAETVADAVVEQLNLEDLVTDQVNISGIFGPLTEDVVRAFEDILAEVLGAIDDLPEDFNSIVEAVNQILEDTEQLLGRLPADFGAAVEDGVEAVLDDLGLSEFLDDPVAWFLDRLETFVLDRLDDETEQEIQQLAEVVE